ncbi:MAG: DMT family transporter [Verrucomicrobia bacterium]|nr:DMT family transporter [Verrucomicrobiota bacterium]
MFSSKQLSVSTLVNYFLLFGCGLIWGSQYLLNKIALESFSTWTIAAGRVGIGALTLTVLLLARAEKSTASTASFWTSFPDFLLIGFLEATLPCLLIAWAQKQLPSSVTAILIGTVPLFATLLELLLIKDHTVSFKKSCGIVLGFIGVIILIGPGLLLSHLLNLSTKAFPLLPVFAVLAGAACFSVAMLLIKLRLGSKFGPIQSGQGILLGATSTALPLMLWMTYPWKSISFSSNAPAFFSIVLLGIFCGGLVYILYVKLINRAGPSFASTCNYLVPPIGAFLGIVFCGEKMTPNIVGALALILVALWLSHEKKKSTFLSL